MSPGHVSYPPSAQNTATTSSGSGEQPARSALSSWSAGCAAWGRLVHLKYVEDISEARCAGTGAQRAARFRWELGENEVTEPRNTGDFEKSVTFLFHRKQQVLDSTRLWKLRCSFALESGLGNLSGTPNSMFLWYLQLEFYHTSFQLICGDLLAFKDRIG